MVLPVIILVAIPIFLGILFAPPFELPEETEPAPNLISEEPSSDILYIILIGIWIFFLMRILLRIKRGTFKITHRY